MSGEAASPGTKRKAATEPILSEGLPKAPKTESAAADPLAAADGDGGGGGSGGAFFPREKQLKIGRIERPDGKSCVHDLCFPPDGWKQSDDEDKDKALPSGPAKEYAFRLDPFQTTAAQCLEQGESVMVAAHTSAGKTVVAEYAIAMALRDGQRVIYTSPLKALSNQKYRELSEEFQDVGLMTGDNVINPNASCVVMTTEILRSMLYRGAQILREVRWVIFDEIHYLRDKERGVVWEESIILQPEQARFVFLSATIPNAAEFASWVAKVHRQPCHVIYTDYRPTPLQHFIFPCGGDGIYLVVDGDSEIKENNFERAMSLVSSVSAGLSSSKKGKGSKKDTALSAEVKDTPEIYKLVKMIIQRAYDPAIVFAFSKKECEALASHMVQLDLNGEEEKKLVEGVFWNAMESLPEDDRKIPLVQGVLPLLKRGIGIHHGGLLPIIKEVIEILFQEGLLKVLFATETFSTGLNMPARTVVFTNARKHDGESFRWITGGEYTQMAGRAGRRGLDDKGTVIVMVDSKMESKTVREMLLGKSDPLNSAFGLRCSMLLNMYRMEDGDPEAVCSRSFLQYQAESSLPSLKDKLVALEKEREEIAIESESKVQELYELYRQLHDQRDELRTYIMSPVHALPYLQPGRLVSLYRHDADELAGLGNQGKKHSEVWGVVVNFERKDRGVGLMANEAKENRAIYDPASYTVDILANCSISAGDDGAPTPCSASDAAKARKEGFVVEPVVLPLGLNDLEQFSSIRINIPKDLRQKESREFVGKALSVVPKRFDQGIPVLDPEEDMKITDSEFRKIGRRIESLESDIRNHRIASEEDVSERLLAARRKRMISKRIGSVKREVKAALTLVQKQELKSYRRVLRKLGYIDDQGVVTTRGHVACNISSGDELVATELIFNGELKTLDVDTLVALVSCFVWKERGGQQQQHAARLPETMQAPLLRLQDAARRVGVVYQDAGLSIDVEEYVDSFRPELMEIAYSWSRGSRFADICKMSSLFEGSVIRGLRRLEELLRQLQDGVREIGEKEMEAKFLAAREKIKRDIVFAPSLYL